MSGQQRVDVGRLVTSALVGAVVVLALVVGHPGVSATEASPPAPVEIGPPASVADFCASFADLNTAHQSALASAAPEDVVALKAAATSTRDVAERTADMPADARLGILFVLELFQSLPDDAGYDAIASSDHVPTFEEEAQADAFITFMADACPAKPIPN